MTSIDQTPGLNAAMVVEEYQTMGVTTVVMLQIFHLLNCRSLRDSIFKIGVFINKTLFIGIATVILPVISLKKWLRNRMEAGRADTVALRFRGS